MFTVMTWNVENLFRPGSSAGPGAQAVYEAKLKGLASMINDHAPTVVGLQEVGDPVALGDLVDLLDGTWQQQISSRPDQRGIRVAWLSQRPIAASEEVVAFPAPLAPVQRDDQVLSAARVGHGRAAVVGDGRV